MNFQKLQKDFKIRYSSDKTPICAFSGYPLFLLGDVLCDIGYSSLSTTLSMGTAIAFNKADNNIFSVQKNNDNTLFSCKINNLLSYHENDFSRSVFKFIGELLSSDNINLNGGDMLFLHNTEDKQFHNYLSSLFAVLFSLFTSKLTAENLVSSMNSQNYSKKEISSVLTSIYSYQNSCIITDNRNYEYMQYPLPISDKKIIITKIPGKNPHISQALKTALCSYKKYAVENNLNLELDPDLLLSDIPLTEKEKKLLFFALNEEKRIKNYAYISDFGQFSSMINASANEMLGLFNCRSFSLIAEIFSSTNHALAFRPLPDDLLMYCIVYNDAVDSFIKFVEKEFEKKASLKPAFFICDTSASGINFVVMPAGK